jgi:hypothetical protein
MIQHIGNKRKIVSMLDTNSDGDIDMECGDYINDSTIEWLEE